MILIIESNSIEFLCISKRRRLQSARCGADDGLSRLEVSRMAMASPLGRSPLMKTSKQLNQRDLSPSLGCVCVGGAEGGWVGGRVGYGGSSTVAGGPFFGGGAPAEGAAQCWWSVWMGGKEADRLDGWGAGRRSGGRCF